MAKITRADQILDTVYAKLGLSSSSSRQKYENLQKINRELDRLNARDKFTIKTTGTINERLVQLALDGYVPKSWYKLTDNKYQWLGDFGIQGYPLSVMVSVKSFKAKERLLVSGTGSLLAPTLGWGRFDDETEFSIDRLDAYLFRGFLSIYLPDSTLNKVTWSARHQKNFFGKPFLRSINDFGLDLENSLQKQTTGIQSLLDISLF